MKFFNSFILFIFLNLSITLLYGSSHPFHIVMVLWDGSTSMETGFLKYLHDKKISFTTEVHDCKGDRQTCHNLIPTIRASKPDLIYVWGTPATEEIAGHIDDSDTLKKDYIQDIPILSLCVTDPIKTRLIKSTKKTGRNMTGVTHVAPLTTQLKAMTSYLPKLKTIAALYNPLEPNGYYQVCALQELAALHNIQVIELPIALQNGVPQTDCIPKLITRAQRLHAEFLYLPSDTFLSTHMDIIMHHANMQRLLTFASTESHYWNGSPLLGVFNRFVDVGQFGARKAVAILRDKVPVSSIPFETLPKASVVIAKNTFHAIKCPPPLAMLQFAYISKN